MHLFPFNTAEFLDHFWEQFIADMDASTIVLELEHRGIISNGDQKTSRQEVKQHWQEVKQHWQEVNATLAGSECNTGRK